ncbi:MAG TPA: hypothetical protein ENI87_03975 [bacterium]|nr:hypothetical protein [bacterium]
MIERTRAPLLASLLCLHAVAQCGLTVSSAGVAPDADDSVLSACLWDPDGAGPLAPVAVIGGRFRRIGGVVADGLATFDPTTGSLSTFGPVTSSAQNQAPEVRTLLVLANGDLVVGGQFASIGGVPAPYLARWDGSSWHAYPGLPGPVDVVTEMPNGELVVSGPYQSYGAQILRLGPSGWNAIALPPTGSVATLDVLPNGDLLVAGADLLPGAVGIARWDGIAWSTFGPGLVGPGVVRAKVLANGNVLAYGLFQPVYGNPTSHVSIWDGNAWTDLAGGLSRQALAAIELANGDLVVGGAFENAGGVLVNQVARWDGSAWQAMGGGLGEGGGLPLRPVRALLELPGGDILAGGDFSTEGDDFNFVARWDGSAWGGLRAGTGGAIHAVCELGSGELVVGGSFTAVEGVAARHVALRSNGVWQPLGAGVDGRVFAICELGNGDIVVAGEFLVAGGVAASRVARWDGVAWHAIGSGLPDTVHALAVAPGGQLLAHGDFADQVAVWDGVTWNGTGVGGPLSPLVTRSGPQQVVTGPGGDVFALVSTNAASPYTNAVARWDGSSWLPVTGGALVQAGPVLVLADGGFLRGLGGSVLRWDGSQWNILGDYFDAPVRALAELPDGSIIAGGAFTVQGVGLPPNPTPGTPAQGLARWDGSTWQAYAGEVGGEVDALLWSSRGRLHVVGDYWSLGSTPASNFAAIESTCPGAATTTGSPCNGVALAANSLPWVGGTFSSTVGNTPSSGLVVEVYGLQPASAPVALPQSTCQLLVTPDLVRFAASAGTVHELAFAIPNQPSLVGTTFYQQALAVAIAANGAIAAIDASNALAVLIGQF